MAARKKGEEDQGAGGTACAVACPELVCVCQILQLTNLVLIQKLHAAPTSLAVCLCVCVCVFATMRVCVSACISKLSAASFMLFSFRLGNFCVIL